MIESYRLIAAIVAFAAVSLAAPATVHADCGAGIRGLETALAGDPKNAQAQKVANMIAKSKDALVDGKPKKCENILAKAKAAFEEGKSAGGAVPAAATASAGKAGGKGDGAPCLARIEKLESRAAFLPNAPRTKVSGIIYEARKAAEGGEAQKCQKLAGQADKMIAKFTQ